MEPNRLSDDEHDETPDRRIVTFVVLCVLIVLAIGFSIGWDRVPEVMSGW